MARPSSRALECTDPSFPWQSLVLRDRSGGVAGWFAPGAQIFYSLNARTAIQAACDLLGLGSGTEVLAPAYNCGSEIDPLLHAGAKVRLYRVDRQARIDLADLVARVTPRTRAVYVTHYFGFPQPEIAALATLCRDRGLHLIEDCALGLFSRVGDRALGTFGDVSVFCFHKYFPLIGGGALQVNRADLAARCRDAAPFPRPAPLGFVGKAVLRAALQALFGKAFLARLRWIRGGGRDSAPGSAGRAADALPDMPGHYYFDPGFQDARMSVLSLRALGSFHVTAAIEQRRANFRAYLEHLAGTPGVDPLFPDLPEGVCPLSFPVLVAERDRVCAELNARSIGATPWWAGYHQRVDWDGTQEAQFLKDRVLSLPLHQYLDAHHIAHVSEQLRLLVPADGAMATRATE